MHRFYNPDFHPQPGPLTLTDNEASHAVRVLRVQPGTEVTVLNGKGVRALARVRGVARKQVDLEVQTIEEAPRPKLEITLLQALTKPASMDWIVEKATELGVHRVQPILAERVVSRLDEHEAAKKVEKWQRTAIEALKQCGGTWLPTIELPRTLARVLQDTRPLQCQFVASLSAQAGELRHSLAQLNLSGESSSPSLVGVWVGPEGDFTEEETAALVAAGAIPITLGNTVLRSETASVCAVTLIRYEFGLMLHGSNAER
jgi:16S rRNA (uracil1498-N3)-methyltransferase